MTALDREAVLDLLRQVGAHLLAQGVTASIYVVGGSAMSPVFDRVLRAGRPIATG